jgi:hypothetical protein
VQLSGTKGIEISAVGGVLAVSQSIEQKSSGSAASTEAQKTA